MTLKWSLDVENVDKHGHEVCFFPMCLETFIKPGQITHTPNELQGFGCDLGCEALLAGQTKMESHNRPEQRRSRTTPGLDGETQLYSLVRSQITLVL